MSTAHGIPSIVPRRKASFAESFEAALGALKRSTGVLVRTGAMASMLVLGPGAGFVACALDDGRTPSGPVLPDGISADGWLDSEGVRDTSMVSYLDSSWHEYRDCNNRGGCMSIAVFLKVRVQPVAGARLEDKRVGVVYSSMGGEPQTAVGHYFTTYDNGDEEWHVQVDRRAAEPGVLRFDVWYQDGRGNTYYDDNNGEAHVEAYHGHQSVIYHYWRGPDADEVTVGEDGVRGRVELVLADIDFDKDVRIVWTTDGWATVNELGMGVPGTTNALYWVEDLWHGYERWAVDLDIEGPASRFEYAAVYRHGVVNGARSYEFWDNNGGRNHIVERAD